MPHDLRGPFIQSSAPTFDNPAWLNSLDVYTKLLSSAVFNVQDSDYGATGDGTTDDTVAIQAAITAALAVGGTVYFPAPSTAYKVTDTLDIAAGQAYLNLVAPPISETNSLIAWAGSNSTPVFSTRGWRNSTIQNISVRVPGTKTGTTVWDIDTAVGQISSTGLAFHNCRAFFAPGASAGYGWRMGASGLTNDISCISWYDCQVVGASDNKNQIGWSFDQANAIQFQWFGGLGFFLSPMVKMTSGEGFVAVGLSGTTNVVDYQLAGAHPLTVIGGRYELGGKFLSVSHNTNQPQNISVIGSKIHNYTPPGGIMFDLLGLPNLTLDEVQIVNRSGADYTSSMIRHYCDSAGQGNTFVRGGVIQAPYPFHTITGGSTGTYRIRCESVSRVTNAGVYSATLGTDQSHALTYSGTIATDANLSDIFTITATNGTAFTISNPTNPFAGRTITYDIKNSSGGAMGVVTWGAAFKLAGAFVNPANGLRRTISFYYDGTNWVETNRAAADI